MEVSPSLLPNTLPVKYLDLTMSIISPPALSSLLHICRNLEKLSLEHVTLSGEVVEALRGSAQSLQTLNLCMCYGLEAEAFADFLRLCPA